MNRWPGYQQPSVTVQLQVKQVGPVTSGNPSAHNGAGGRPPEDHPGQHGGTLFKHVRSAIATRLAQRKRATGPAGRPGAQGGDLEDMASSWLQLDDDDNALGVGGAKSVTSKESSDADAGDSSGNGDQQSGKRRSKQICQARLLPEGHKGRGAGSALRMMDIGGRLSKAAGGPHARRELAAAAMAAIDRISPGPAGKTEDAVVRRALLGELKHHVRPDAAGGGLADVRADLVEAALGLERGASSSSPSAQSLRRLLPLVLLNMQRPRTESQAGVTQAKLDLLSKA
jgi:hypothetical protein